jgi:hypothetical protein
MGDNETRLKRSRKLYEDKKKKKRFPKRKHYEAEQET